MTRQSGSSTEGPNCVESNNRLSPAQFQTALWLHVTPESGPGRSSSGTGAAAEPKRLNLAFGNQLLYATPMSLFGERSVARWTVIAGMCAVASVAVGLVQIYSAGPNSSEANTGRTDVYTPPATSAVSAMPTPSVSPSLAPSAWPSSWDLDWTGEIVVTSPALGEEVYLELDDTPPWSIALRDSTVSQISYADLKFMSGRLQTPFVSSSLVAFPYQTDLATAAECVKILATEATGRGVSLSECLRSRGNARYTSGRAWLVRHDVRHVSVVER